MVETISSSELHSTDASSTGGAKEPQQPSAFLPREVVLEVLSNIPQNLQGQHDLASLCLTCRFFYLGAIERLYSAPCITSRNFDALVRTLCPSVNLHVRRSGFGSLVRRLDMSNLLYNGSKSLTARLLGRVKENLVEFVAPAATFSIGCFAALAKCQKLRILDLSFVLERINFLQLFKTVGKLSNLQELYLRMGTAHDYRDSAKGSLNWPPKLRHLSIGGHICLEGVRSLKDALTASECPLSSLQISKYCPRCYKDVFLSPGLTNNLLYLDLGAVQEDFFEESRNLLLLNPRLIELSIGYRNIEAMLYVAGDMSPPHPLRILRLKQDPSKYSHSPFPDWDVQDVIEVMHAGGLSKLRQILVEADVHEDFLSQIVLDDTCGTKELDDLMSDFQLAEAEEAARQGRKHVYYETGVRRLTRGND